MRPLLVGEAGRVQARRAQVVGGGTYSAALARSSAGRDHRPELFGRVLQVAR